MFFIGFYGRGIVWCLFSFTFREKEGRIRIGVRMNGCIDGGVSGCMRGRLRGWLCG